MHCKCVLVQLQTIAQYALGALRRKFKLTNRVGDAQWEHVQGYNADQRLRCRKKHTTFEFCILDSTIDAASIVCIRLIQARKCVKKSEMHCERVCAQ